jgi:two-component system, NarL family, response regulator DevR
MQGYTSQVHRVYLVDDHDIVRRGLRDMLATAQDIVVVGDSGSAREAMKAAPELRPDVMVLDLHLQDGSGIQVCREVRSVDPTIRAVLLTAAGEEEALVSTILAGAAGYAVKLASSSDLPDAIRRVADGKTLLDPAVANRAAERLLAEMDKSSPGLTGSEHRILVHLLDGLTNQQIADRIEATVDQVCADVEGLIEKVTRLDPAWLAPR